MSDWYDRYKHRIQLNGITSQERIINQKKRDFDKYLKNTPNRFEVNINNDMTNKYLISLQDVTINNKYGDEKYVVTYNETPIKIGSTFSCLENTWLVVEKEHNVIQDHQTFKAGTCTHILNFLNSKGDPCSSPCIIEDATKYSNGIYENKDIKVGDTRQQLTIPDNKDTKDLYIGKRILTDKIHAYEVSDIKPSSPKGLRMMILEQTEIHHGIDNLDLLIADYYGNAHEYKVEILNKSLILNINDTYKLQVNVYDKQTKIDNPEIIYDVYDKEIASIENGILTGLKEGVTDIAIRYKDVTDTINVQVVTQQTPSNNYSIEIIGKDSMAISRTRDYPVKIYNNGIETTDNVKWSITDENGNSTDYASIVSSDNTKCTVKTTSEWIFGNDGKSKYFYLHCKANNVVDECVKKIKVTSY